MKDGRRAGKCELSTVDSAFLLAGMLAAAAFFDEKSPAECEIREAADALLRRADWEKGVRATMIGVKPDGQRLTEIAEIVDDGKLGLSFRWFFP